jgi:hypothetical protein
MGWENTVPFKNVIKLTMNKIKTKKSQRFFGQRGSEIKDRFIFVEELSDIFMSEGVEKESLFLKLQVYDSAKNEFSQDKAIVVLHEDIYNELFAFLLYEIDAANKIREGLDSFTKIENVISDFKKLTSKNEDYEQN